MFQVFIFNTQFLATEFQSNLDGSQNNCDRKWKHTKISTEKVTKLQGVCKPKIAL